MRKWLWLGLFAVAAVPQSWAISQEAEKKGDGEKKEAPKVPAAPVRAAGQAAAQAALKPYNEIRALAGKKEFEAAEKLFEETLKENPAWPYAPSAHVVLAQAYSDAEEKEKAGEHALAYLEMQTKLLAKNPRMLGNLGLMVRKVAPIIKESGKADEVIANLEKTLEEAAKEGTDRTTILGAKIRALAALGKKDVAEKAVAEIDDETKKTLENDPKLVKNIVARLNALDIAIENFAEENVEKGKAFAEEKKALFERALAEFPKDLDIAERHLNDEFTTIARMGAEKYKEAEERLEKVTAKVKELADGAEEAAANRFERFNATITQLKRRLESSKKQFELIGQPALPFDGEFTAWVNGPELKDADLKGKVVLIDFWAVWCNPCIATFPHLIEWREKYGDKGFEIVGVTQYYQYDWDEDAKQSKREENLAPEKEQAAMVKFAEHHKLKHAFAIKNADSKMSEFYGVQGIPTAVLVDKEGKVKLIRVGSGDQNAHDLEAGIREALGLPAEEAK